MFDSPKFDFVRQRYPALLSLPFFITIITFAVSLFVLSVTLFATPSCQNIKYNNRTMVGNGYVDLEYVDEKVKKFRICEPRDCSTPLFILLLSIFIIVVYLYDLLNKPKQSQMQQFQYQGYQQQPQMQQQQMQQQPQNQLSNMQSTQLTNTQQVTKI